MALGDVLPPRHDDLPEVGVERLPPVTTVDDNVIAIAVGEPLGPGHPAIAGGIDGRGGVRPESEVDASVDAAPATVGAIPVANESPRRQGEAEASGGDGGRGSDEVALGTHHGRGLGFGVGQEHVGPDLDVAAAQQVVGAVINHVLDGDVEVVLDDAGKGLAVTNEIEMRESPRERVFLSRGDPPHHRNLGVVEEHVVDGGV